MYQLSLIVFPWKSGHHLDDWELCNILQNCEKAFRIFNLTSETHTRYIYLHTPHPRHKTLPLWDSQKLWKVTPSIVCHSTPSLMHTIYMSCADFYILDKSKELDHNKTLCKSCFRLKENLLNISPHETPPQQCEQTHGGPVRRHILAFAGNHFHLQHCSLGFPQKYNVQCFLIY